MSKKRDLKVVPQRHADAEGNFYSPIRNAIGPGMNERIQRLRKLSVETEPSLSIERALHETAFYKENYGKHSTPMLRALNFLDHCQKKTLYLGDGELIVAERGPQPKAVPTFPELTCHSVEDFHVLNTRDQQRYTISDEDVETYSREVIPYWQGKTIRERIFSHAADCG
jgi:formate C-acetyltransferase